LLKRFRKSARAISRWGESASRHFKTSPGGKIPSSSRNLPVLPPLSTMETIASIVISLKSLNPDRSAYWPLPPPIVVIFVFGIESLNPDKPESKKINTVMQKASAILFQPRRTRRGIVNLFILFYLANLRDLRVLGGEITIGRILLELSG